MIDRNSLIKKAINDGLFPRYVYKYRKLNSNTEDMLRNNQFWFAQADTFNDPFDCNLSEINNYKISDLRNYFNSRPALNNVADSLIKRAKKEPSFITTKAFNSRRKMTNQHGILSLSKTYDNMLMWSHYTSSHKGIVICLDMLEDPLFFDTPINVKYQKTYKPLNFFADQNQTVIDNIQIKSSDWAYEQEIRIIKPNHGLFTIDKKAIKKIYFGINTDKRDINKIKSLCNTSGYVGVQYFQAQQYYGAFKLTFPKI